MPMFRFLAIPVVVGLALATGLTAHPASAAPPTRRHRGDRTVNEQLAPLVEAGNRFAFDLYDRLRSADGNLFFSPASISVALAMTYAGAAGSTETEMAKTLHFEMPKSQLNEQMRALLESLNAKEKRQGYRLEVANRLWGQDGSKFLDDFLKVTRDDYGAELARLDFHQPEAARDTINKWVEDKTQDKIKDLIASPSSISGARLVLTNAVYFKGEWHDPFKSNLTKPETFHVSRSRSHKTPLMHQKHHFRYAAGEGLQLLDLPYGDDSLSMIVLLPNKVEGLAHLESSLSTANLQRWLDAARSEEVIVYLPKFKTSAEFQLAGTLKAMGMPSAFDPTSADFSGMSGQKDLFISAVMHKAFVDVNEEGTEAAAATGVVMRPMAMRGGTQEPPVFRADHPFVFLIRDNRSGAILFLGRVVDPQK
jgi:serpin B